VTTFEVAQDSLDRLLLDRDRAVAMIKIDVEGGEFDVLCGALGLIKQDRPLLLVEVDFSGEQAGSVLRLLRDHGYLIRLASEDTGFLVPLVERPPDNVNLLAIPDDKTGMLDLLRGVG
jgi:hypothetical protein